MLLQEVGCECAPVLLGVCGMVGVEIARCAAEFAGDGHLEQQAALLLQTVHKHLHLLA